MKKVIVILIFLFTVSTIFALGFNFDIGAGFTVGDPHYFYGGVSTYAVFDKNLIDGKPCDVLIQLLVGYDIFTFGYGCILKSYYEPSTNIEKFDSVMSVGFNTRLTDFISILTSFSVNTRQEIGLSLAMIFNLGIYTYPY